MNRVEQDKIIRSGTPLLYLESSYRQLTDRETFLAYALSITPALALGKICGAPFAACIMLFFMGVPIVGYVHEFMKEASERQLGMVVTNKGISLSPSCCAFWKEIKAWDFRSYSCLGRFRTDKPNKMSLCLFVDDLNIDHGPFTAGRAGSAFAARGYFLNELQQEQWRQICSERSIPRCL